MQLTQEQLDIINHAVTSPNHLLVEARAGAAKTTTLVKMAEQLVPLGDVLCLAFNASIKKEMQDRMPQEVTCQTLHGCGFAAWRRYLGTSLTVENDKIYDLFKAALLSLPKPEQDELWENYGELKKVISAAKNAGVLFPPHSRRFTPLLSPEDFFLGCEFNLSREEQALVEEISRASWKMTCEGRLDFDDMLLAPAVAGVTFPTYRFVLVDEAQDLSPINHHLLSKLTRPAQTKLIGVGDPFQAIYGFRGADSNSMPNLRRQYNADTLNLTISFRCPRAVVRAAHWRASDMRWPEWAEEGVVEELETWGPSTLPADCAILCRNNAPLFKLAFALLGAGRSVEVAGRDITKQLARELRGLSKKDSMSQEHVMIAIDAWESAKKLRIKDQNLVRDQATCLRIIAEQAATLGEAVKAAEALAGADGRIKLFTGHRAKGLEFDTVFFLDRELCNIRREPQDANIYYVIQTRAKKRLVYVESEGFVLRPETAARHTDDVSDTSAI